jgi:hypothetical protein
VEPLGVASASQSGSTVTLGTLTRQLSLTDGSTFTSGGSGYTFPANTNVYLTWDVFDAERTMKDDKVNTLTGSGAIRSTSTTVPAFRLNNVTTAQRNAMTPANGDPSIGGTGRTSLTAGALLIGAGTSAMTAIGPGTVGQVPVSNGTTLAMGSVSHLMSAITADSSEPTDTTYVNFGTYSSPASDIAAGTVYRFTAQGTYNGGTSGRQPTIAIRIGSTAVLEIGTGTNPTVSTVFGWRFEGEFVCRSTGAGSAVVQATGTFFASVAAGAERAFFGSTTTSTIDTTATNTLAISGKLSASGTGTSFLAKNAFIRKFALA